MLWLSGVLVFGTVGWLVWQMGGDPSQLRPGFEQLIHARVPWGILALLVTAAALGIASGVRRPRWTAWSLVGVELLLLGTFANYFLRTSMLPPSELKLQAGDAFPSYALEDQDRQLHRLASGEPREPALYVFYRGDW